MTIVHVDPSPVTGDFRLERRRGDRSVVVIFLTREELEQVIAKGQIALDAKEEGNADGRTA